MNAIPLALDGYVCNDCQILFLASEATKVPVNTYGCPAIEYRCVSQYCQSPHIEACSVCPICEVRRSAEGYDECVACAQAIDNKALDEVIRARRAANRTREQAEFLAVLADIARSGLV